MTGREKARLRWNAVIDILGEYGECEGLIVVYRWTRCDGVFAGKGILICRKGFENAQVYTTFTERHGRTLQIGYRFRRKRLWRLLPHPQILAG